MTGLLQVLLVLFCTVLFVLIVREINKSRIIFSDFNYWLVFVVFLLIMAIFPKGAYIVSDLLGVQTPVIGVFLMVVGLLILLSLSLAFRISVLNRRFIQLTQKIAIVEEELNNKIDQYNK